MSKKNDNQNVRDSEAQILNTLKKWVNHTKEANGRLEDSYPQFEKLWTYFRGFYSKLISIESEELHLITKPFFYKGNVYRIHRKWDIQDPMGGIIESKFYQSWSKSNNFSENVYWIHDNVDYLLIEATIPADEYAIDLNEICYSMGFELGSPAIVKEQEVVYPIKYQNINRISVISFNSGKIIEKKIIYIKPS